MKVMDKGIITILKEEYAHEAEFYASSAQFEFDNPGTVLVVHVVVFLLLAFVALRYNGKTVGSRFRLLWCYSLPMGLALVSAVFGANVAGEAVRAKLKNNFIELAYVDVAEKIGHANMYYNILIYKKINDQGLPLINCIWEIGDQAANGSLVCDQGKVCGLDLIKDVKDREMFARQLNKIVQNTANAEKLPLCKGVIFSNARWEAIRKE